MKDNIVKDNSNKKILTVADLPENAGISDFLKTGIMKKDSSKK